MTILILPILLPPQWKVAIMPSAFFFVVLIIASAAFTARVAHEKGYDPVLWSLGGLFFPMLALIAAAGLPDRAGEFEARAAEAKARETKAPADMLLEETRRLEQKRKADPMNFESKLPPLPEETTPPEKMK